MLPDGLPLPYFTLLSALQGSTNRAKNFLPFLQRARRMAAVVEYVLSGHRFKLLVPKDSCTMAFSLAGVRCPGRGEPFSEQAIAFMRRRIMQQDVEVRDPPTHSPTHQFALTASASVPSPGDPFLWCPLLRFTAHPGPSARGGDARHQFGCVHAG